LQAEQIAFLEPGAEPSPPQFPQTWVLLKLTVFSTPRATSSRLISTCAPRSLPLALLPELPLWEVPKRSKPKSEKKSPNIDPKPESPNMLEKSAFLKISFRTLKSHQVFLVTP